MGDPRKNVYLQLQAARKEIAELRMQIEIMKGFTLQQSLDVARIELNREFGFGPKMNGRFKAGFKRTFIEYAQMCVTDGKDDPEIVYTKVKFDRALRQACGDDEPEFDVRYALENLFFRDNLEKESKEWLNNLS